MKKIAVLMSTYNGEKYLREQLDSILNQKNVEVSILIRDDGSTDSTIYLLDAYKNKYRNISWYNGKNIRTAKSFIDLIINAPKDVDYYAFSDQDDVWIEDKLSRAVDLLEELDSSYPRLYCSNYQLVDNQLHYLPDNNHVSTETFGAALVSSCCTGCTTVFDKKLKEFLSIEIPNYILMHDDWAHKVCLAVGGSVFYDKEKHILYRQHGNNVDGGVRTLSSRIKKIVYRINSKDKIRSKQLKEIERIYGRYMPVDNRALLHKVANYDSFGLVKRIMLSMDNRIKTPYSKMNRGFTMAIIMKYY